MDDASNKLEADENFAGPRTERKCTDVLWLLIIIAHWIAVTYLAFVSFGWIESGKIGQGRPQILTNWIDHNGYICGKRRESGSHQGLLESKPYLYFPNPFGRWSDMDDLAGYSGATDLFYPVVAGPHEDNLASSAYGVCVRAGVAGRPCLCFCVEKTYASLWPRRAPHPDVSTDARDSSEPAQLGPRHPLAPPNSVNIAPPLCLRPASVIKQLRGQRPAEGAIFMEFGRAKGYPKIVVQARQAPGGGLAGAGKFPLEAPAQVHKCPNSDKGQVVDYTTCDDGVCDTWDAYRSRVENVKDEVS